MTNENSSDFRDGYARGVSAASAIAMNMPLSKEWLDLTDRVSETTVQAMAWRAAMAILNLPKSEKTSDVGRGNPQTDDPSKQKNTGQDKTLEVIKEHFAQELLNLLTDYPEIFVFGREHEYGIGCGNGLKLKLQELAKTDAERTAAMNVVGVSYRPC